MSSTKLTTAPLLGQGTSSYLSGEETSYPVLICLLGDFHLLKLGQTIRVESGGKAELLLCSLALRQGYLAPRDILLSTLWPITESSLACQSLNTLIHRLHKLLSDGIGGAAPVLYADGYYELNVEAGIGIDVAWFDALATEGARQASHGNLIAAAVTYTNAVSLYHGDLCVANDVFAIMESERLRARYLSLLAKLAEYSYSQRDYQACLYYALRLLVHDPCREDAHRMAMRGYVRLGERAQALRQYRVCANILRSEFDTEPEQDTKTLFDRIRLDPESI